MLPEYTFVDTVRPLGSEALNRWADEGWTLVTIVEHFPDQALPVGNWKPEDLEIRLVRKYRHYFTRPAETAFGERWKQ